MLRPGIYPASVTPFQSDGKIDYPSFARLFAWFEASGCKGAVLAGTNGEGPSLSAIEKRDLLRVVMPLKGSLELILGIATCSSEEAVWLCKQARHEGAAAVLLMAPYYFREATGESIAAWFEDIMSRSPLPVLIYNFPNRTGCSITDEMMARLARHDNFAGAKDSSGEKKNILGYKQAVGDKMLFVGNETLLLDALSVGWTGSISGAANTVPMWLSQVTHEFLETDLVSAETKFELLLPVLAQIRKSPQPSTHKGILNSMGVIDSPNVRLPLENAPDDAIRQLLKVVESQLGPILTGARGA